jgi:hypothetical protein
MFRKYKVGFINLSFINFYKETDEEELMKKE